MKTQRIKDRSGAWERRIQVIPKTDGCSLVFRLRDMERPAKKTVYVEHIFINSNGEVNHQHVKYPLIEE